MKFTIGGIALLSLALAAFGDELPDNKKALGKPESVICGFDTFNTTMGDIIGKLGKADKQTPFSESDPLNVLMEWNKGNLVIDVNTYVIDGYEKKTPVWIRVEGNDANSFCKTGHGIKLGDTFDRVKAVYGKKYGVSTVDGNKTITYQWKDLSEIYFTLTSDNHVKSIHVIGEIE